MGITTFTGVSGGLGLRGRGFDPYSGRHEYCVLEQDILLSKSTGNTQEAVVPSRHDKNCLPGR